MAQGDASTNGAGSSDYARQFETGEIEELEPENIFGIGDVVEIGGLSAFMGSNRESQEFIQATGERLLV